MHPDTEDFQRLLHGELAAADAGAVRAHLGGCADCRHRWEAVQADEAQVSSLLARLDGAPPVPDLDAVLRRARQPAWPARRLAATVLLSAGLATAAFAMPGSPVPHWLDRIVQGVPRPAPAPSLVPAQLPAPGSSGIAVEPGDRFTIDFASPQDSGTVTVRLGDGPMLVATALGPGAAFETAPGRLFIRNQGARIDYEIMVPRTAAQVELSVAGRRLLLKRGPGIQLPVESDTSGSYRIPLAPERGP